MLLTIKGCVRINAHFVQHIIDLHLQLDDNSIGSEGARAAGEAVAKLPNISNLTLDLDDNSIGHPNGVGCFFSTGPVYRQLLDLSQISSSGHNDCHYRDDARSNGPKKNWSSKRRNRSVICCIVAISATALALAQKG